ncbi:MAG TPA: M20/M25/M40 family metallo-hydrolase [Thermoanaerobaculia bacterium]|nr:M20/M25/M40 family metallo-hydrolase [Thermoanaerobaculia bacterium]
MRRTASLATLALAAALTVHAAAPAPAGDGAVDRLVTALLGDTPMIDDLRQLTDEIGGRPTGSAANERAVEWALERFRDAGLAEPFTLPAHWLEERAHARVTGDGVEVAPRVAAMTFSAPTPPGGLDAPLVDAGRGGDADFARLGAAARGAVALVETDPLVDLAGLFASYVEGVRIEERAFAAGVAALAFVGARDRGVLYRHNASRGPATDRPLFVVEREEGLRLLRLLRAGEALSIHLEIEVESTPGFESVNVIGEIPGSAEPEEFVVLGAHLDSFDLGTGALDNGANVAMLIDLARQMRRLELRPRRTIRFALWNAEEIGLHGSWGYTRAHAAELDRHVMAASFDIGTGRITGFFTGGRPEVAAATARALAPVAGLGPFTQVDAPIVGTDNFDFMMQGIGNLVANQESASYGPNYHAETDTFDKVDQRQLRLNAAIAAAVAWGFANMEVDWGRQGRAEIEALIESTDLERQMRSFSVWESWERGERGRSPDRR